MDTRKRFKLNPMAAAILVATATGVAIPMAFANGGGVGLGSDGVTSVQTFYANTYIKNEGADGTTNAVRGLRKFVDTLPGLTSAGTNNLGQYIPLAVSDKASYPGSDYYEIAVVEYAEKLHSELAKATTLRGYVQIDRAMTNSAQYNAADVAAYNAYLKALASYNTALANYKAYQTASAAYAASTAGLAAAQTTYTGNGAVDSVGNPLDYTAYNAQMAAFNAAAATYNSALNAYNQYQAAQAGQASANQLLSLCAFLTTNGAGYACASLNGWPTGAVLSVTSGVWTLTGFTYGYVNAANAATLANYAIVQPLGTGNIGTNTTTAPVVDLPSATAPTLPVQPSAPVAPPVPTYTYTDPVTTTSVTTAYVANLSTGVLSGPAQPAVVANPGVAPTPVPQPTATTTPTPSAGSKGIALFYPDGITPIMVYKEVGDPTNTGKWDHTVVQPLTMVQAYGYDKPHYLGPTIVATRGTAVRMKFDNLLPGGRAVTNPDGSVTRNGDLFLPVDETLTGAGFGPDGATKYLENRVSLHWHGGDTPWISDGTPHQWIQPASDEALLGGITVGGANAHMGRGASQQNVPDMPDPGPGAETNFWPNNMSNRLMFYHDHAVAITCLNVYGGMAAGYLLTDTVEAALSQAPGTVTTVTPDPTVPGVTAAITGVGLPMDQIPLVIQDKTFVPYDIAQEDARWDTNHWGAEGDLWYPHVYETNQNPGGASDGTNPVGRWDYGPWFWPVFPAPLALPSGNYGDVTTTPEGFMDTPLVNGTAYPTLTVEPKAYRLRILNAANDRMLNLGFYVADPGVTTPDGRINTEVRMVPFSGPNGATATTYTCPDGSAPGLNVGDKNANGTVTKLGWTESGVNNAGKILYPNSFPCAGGLQGTGWGNQDARPGGVPDPSLAGPDIVQIGTEGGFLPNPVVISSTPINYEYNKRSVTVLNVYERGLFLGTAERADVVVDFSQYAGKTLILYNDSPAPLPAGDPRIDYFTEDGDQTAAGGSMNTVAGFGPNTRTVMQIKVGTSTTGTPAQFTVGTPADPATNTPATGLYAALPKAYAAAQEAPYVTESAYNNAYGTQNADNFATIYAGSSIQPNFVFTPTTAATQFVQSVSVTAQGLGYTVAPKVVFSGAGLANPVTMSPTATTGAQVAGGKLTSIILDSTTIAALVNLTTAPTVSIVAQPDPVTHSTAAGVGASAQALTNQSISTAVKNKAIQELFDPSYGRMNATLGVELPFTSPLNQTTIPLGYIDQPTEQINDGEIQIWKITHNGVDSHPVHFHLFNLQVINRTGWDGTIKPPYDNEQGWKETVKMNPLEDIYVAVKPRAPKAPFGVPESVRLWDPTQPAGAITGFTQIDPVTGAAPVDPVTGNTIVYANQLQNYGWEYVWHCHILGHEENDFMRSIVFGFGAQVPSAPTALTATGTVSGTAAFPVSLKWTDPTPAASTTTPGNKKNEIGFKIYRAAAGSTTFTQVGAALANATSFTDTAPATSSGYQYQVVAYNSAGTSPAANGTIGTVAASPAPLAASNLSAPAVAYNSVTLRWRDNSGSATGTAQQRVAETGFAVWRASGACSTTSVFTQIGSAPAHTGVSSGNFNTWPTWADTTMAPNATYCYKVVAMNGATAATGTQPTATVNVPAAPNLAGLTAPSNLFVQLTSATAAVATFTDLATAEDLYVVQVSTDSGKTWGDGTNTTGTQVAPAYVATLTRTGTAKTGAGAPVTISINNNNLTFTSGNTPYIFRAAAATVANGIVTAVGPWSNTSTIDVSGSTVIAPPTAFTAAAGAASATLAWTDNANNNSTYTLQYSVNGGTTWTNVGTGNTGITTGGVVSGSATGATVRGLTGGTSYLFRIRAQSLGTNASSWVTSAAVVPTVPAPATPANPAANQGGFGAPITASVSWTASANATSYNLVWSTSATALNAVTGTTTPVSAGGNAGVNVVTGIAGSPYTYTAATGIASGTRVYFKLQAVNASGNSAWTTAFNSTVR